MRQALASGTAENHSSNRTGPGRVILPPGLLEIAPKFCLILVPQLRDVPREMAFDVSEKTSRVDQDRREFMCPSIDDCSQPCYSQSGYRGQ
jgi:hypothetical protein